MRNYTAAGRLQRHKLAIYFLLSFYCFDIPISFKQPFLLNI